MIKNNIYGVLGIEAINSMWNADFDGYAKEDGLGNIKGSPYSYQYCMKKLWEAKGDKILGLKGVNSETGKPFTIEEKFKNICDTEILELSNGISKLDKKKDKDKIIELSNERLKLTKQELLKCKDVKNFGVTYPVKENNITLQGVVQILDGLNKYKDTIPNTETILSPYKNSNEKKEDNDMTTNGTRNTLNEAHYVYPFTIMPLLDDCYTEEDYEDFKQISLKAVTLYNSKAKAGCKNEFGLFVKVKEEYNYILALGDLSQYINIDKQCNKVIYDLTELSALLNDCKEKIESIEIYYRSIKNDIEGLELDGINLKKFDIITGKEL